MHKTLKKWVVDHYKGKPAIDKNWRDVDEQFFRSRFGIGYDFFKDKSVIEIGAGTTGFIY